MSASDFVPPCATLFSAPKPTFRCLFKHSFRRLCAAVMCCMPPLLQAQRIDAVPQPAAAPLDLSAIAQGFPNAKAARLPLQEPPHLRIFISLSMPAPTLRRLGVQVERSGGTLVLRGLQDGSLTRTVAKLHELFGERLPALQIDPQAFERYRITQVPTFVLSKATAQLEERSCQASSCTRLSLVKIAGDVSLDYALGLMQQSPVFAPTARALQDRMALPKTPQKVTPQRGTP